MKAQWIARLLLLPLLLAADGLWAKEDVLDRAMRDELARSMQKLQLEGLSKPYFISYRVEDIRTVSVSAVFGSLSSSDEVRMRRLTIEVRVGSYDFDNSNQRSSGVLPSLEGLRASLGVPLPVDDNYAALRRQLWLATDRAYKRALEDFAGKKAAQQTSTKTDTLPDFSQEPTVTLDEAAPPISVKRGPMEQLARNISALFREMPEVNLGRAVYVARQVDERYLNSEGTATHKSTPVVSFAAEAATQAEDGMPLQDTVIAYGASVNDIPAEFELAVQVREMGQRLAKLRNAPVLDNYAGPVLFESGPAGSVLTRVFARRVIGTRAGASSIRLGAEVLPTFLSVTDDPTRTVYSGHTLMGHYSVDDEGVRAQSTNVVEHGTLKALLTSRTPVTGVTHSSGNRRGGSVNPSNLILTTDLPVPPDELRSRFLEMIKRQKLDFGVVIRRLDPGRRADPALRMAYESAAGMGILEAYKVFPDGHEEPVRGALLTEFGPTSFERIAAAGSDVAITTEQLSSVDPQAVGSIVFSGPAVVSAVTPSLLFRKLTLKSPPGRAPKPPIASRPPFVIDKTAQPAKGH